MRWALGIFLVSLVVLSYALLVYAVSQGANSPGTTGVNTSIGTETWLTTSNITSSNDSYSTSNYAFSCGNVKDYSVKLIVGGTISGDDKTTNTELDTTDTYRTYGGATDTWGLSLTPTDINASDFGVGFSATGLNCLP